MVVGEIPDVGIESDYDVIPVSPIEPTTIPLYLFNYGNTIAMITSTSAKWLRHSLHRISPKSICHKFANSRGNFETIEMVIQPHQ